MKKANDMEWVNRYFLQKHKGQINTCAESFSYQKETPTEVLYSEYCEIFKKTYFEKLIAKSCF